MHHNNPITGLVPRSVEWITNWNINPGSQRWPLIIAHRGDTTAAPENTMPAFYRAIKAGANGIELDVRLTRDNELVVFHDYTLGRTSDGYGLVNHYTLEELQSLDAGSWFSPRFKGEPPPSLDQVFESLPRHFLLNVEMKVVIKDMRQIAHRVAETIARHQRRGSTLVASFNPVALYHLRRLDPRIARGYIWSRHHPYPIRARWFMPLVQAHWYNPANDTYDLRVHRNFRRKQRRVLAWDVDFGGDLELMASVGLDAVVTNAPAQMVRRKQQLSREAVDR